MKLFEAFREEIKRMNTIKRAWFTSFNLNPSFVERYILPALVGLEMVPRTSRDFEIIMEHIHQREMDIRFFCDGRMLEIDEGKKTTVNIHPLNIALFDSRFRKGVFHPKVILLQDEQDKSTLFCGSANLTVSGWAQNREGVYKSRIEGRRNAGRVEQFFRKIFEAGYGEDFPEDFAIAADEQVEDWSFSSTLIDETPFLEMLLLKDEQELMIWSPYFSKDISKFVKNNLQGISVHVIPDLQGNKVRILNAPANKEAFNNQNLILKQYKYSVDENRDRMTHAKMWLTGRRLAVGSWNMTQAGIGGNSDGFDNVEAGVICDVSREYLAEALGECQPLECEFMNEKELEEEAVDLDREAFRYKISVVLDWQKRKYIIRWGKAQDSEALVLKLPDQELLIPFSGEHYIREENADRLLQNHMYHLQSGGEAVQVGFIKEINCTMRPVWKYGNLADILFDYITRQHAAGGMEKHRVSYQSSSGESPEQLDEAPEAEEVRVGISYFGMFQAFSGIRDRIEKAIASYETDPEELFRLVRVYPGSIFEIAEKIKIACGEEENINSLSTVFKWYLCQECNSVIVMIKAFSEKRPADTVLLDMANELLQRLPEPPELALPEEAKAYLARVCQRCKYEDGLQV